MWLGYDWGFLDDVGIFPDSELGRAWALQLSSCRRRAAVGGGFRRLHGRQSNLGAEGENEKVFFRVKEKSNVAEKGVGVY